MEQSIRFCTSSDGVKLAYAVTGDGPPLVMSATWLTHLEHQWRSLAWKPWLEALSRDHRLLRYDSRGCGLSDRAIDNLSFETWIKDFEKVIDAAGFGRFSLVSTCWGGPVAIEYAARHPERVDRLVLYGTYARGRLRRSDQPKEVEKARVLLDLTRLGWGLENHAFLQVWANHFQPGGSIEHVRSWCDQQRAATSAEMAVRLLGIGWSVDVSEAARNIKCPVLVMHPERDAVVPIDEGRLLASLIPDARFVTLESDNHVLLDGEPATDVCFDELAGFLSPDAVPPTVPRQPAATAALLDRLTGREREVLDLVAAGHDNREIADRLVLSVRTVERHLQTVYRKLDLTGSAQRTAAAALVLGADDYARADA